ncbi:IS3 family transposase [Wolbachia endosymbiont of Armadillidium arcangelii]|uniref:IS3 family transposase n=1 Tax=Wolbachia endosymbiont of Armadillidium arcangelii TaxID=3158571 RepID=A0AAU7Q2J2_9RICK
MAPCDKEKFELKKELTRVTRERDISKKALGYFASYKDLFIKKHRNYYKVQELCRILKVSASGYYGLVRRKAATREQLLADIQKIYQASNCRYGAPKLKALGKNCNIKTVQDIMQKNKLD